MRTFTIMALIQQFMRDRRGNVAMMLRCFCCHSFFFRERLSITLAQCSSERYFRVRQMRPHLPVPSNM